MSSLETVESDSYKTISQEVKDKISRSLESGKVVYFPNQPFSLEESENQFLSPSILKPKCKNISFDCQKGSIHGVLHPDKDQLKEMVKRFSFFSTDLMKTLFPGYFPKARPGRTSYRPIEARGRKTSHLKNDTLLHVDAFPSSPVMGGRILRVFSNINPHGGPRVWKVGEPFHDVVDKMAPKIKKPLPGLAFFLKTFGLTKGYRTLYDHYMLKIHDAMKQDAAYQEKVPQEKVEFAAGSTWIVYTDLVSHAVVSGQYVLEQTFYIPPSSMHFEQQSPLRILEKKLSQRLL